MVDKVVNHFDKQQFRIDFSNAATAMSPAIQDPGVEGPDVGNT